MKLSEYKREYQDFSRLASERTRIAAFAGIAIIWLFKQNTANGAITLSSDLFYPFILFIFAIAADLFQYVLGYAIWYGFYRYQEQKLEKITDDPELAAPAILAKPVHWLFLGKIALTLVGYVLLSKHIVAWF